MLKFCMPLVVAALSLSAAYAQSEGNTHSKLNHDAHTNNGQSAASTASGGQSPLVDHGGPVLPFSNIWAIYWGPSTDFPGDLQPAMASLLGGLNNSSYLATVQQYMRGAAVSSAYLGSIADTSAPPSKAPKTSDIAAEVCKYFPSPDPKSLYIVFTSNAPNINYCAWHAGAVCNGVPIQVAYVPNQALLPGCSPYTVSNLGCNTYSNGTVSSADSVAHEFMEAVTDPQITAWYDKRGEEVADKCNFVYGACVQLSNGSKWQIQEMWSNSANACVQTASGSASSH